MYVGYVRRLRLTGAEAATRPQGRSGSNKLVVAVSYTAIQFTDFLPFVKIILAVFLILPPIDKRNRQSKQSKGVRVCHALGIFLTIRDEWGLIHGFRAFSSAG